MCVSICISLKLVRMFEWLEVLRNLRQHDGGMLRLLLASALSYTMCTHQHEEFIRDSFDLRHKDLTMIIVTTIVSDDDNDNDDDDDDDTCMVGRVGISAFNFLLNLSRGLFVLLIITSSPSSVSTKFPSSSMRWWMFQDEIRYNPVPDDKAIDGKDYSKWESWSGRWRWWLPASL